MGAQPGERIGPYRLLHQIGGGGMGQVFAATDERTGEAAALKLLSPEAAQDPQIAARFLQEGRALAELKHPGIVRVLACEKLEDGTAYLAMERLEGLSLREWMTRYEGGAELASALAIGQQIADIMVDVHGKGIVHRDLKPDNIIILNPGAACTSEHCVKVLDFGIAKVPPAPSGGFDTQVQTESHTILGTRPYMAPEQFQSSADVTASTDVYSFGVLLFEMIAGRLPFLAEEDVELFTMHLREEPPFLRYLNPAAPAALAVLVASMLAKDPKARPTMRRCRTVLARLRTSHQDECPLPGLQPFVGAQAELFFGRRAEIDDIVDGLEHARTSERRWIQIEGPSGAGKSSLVEAGVRPRLEDDQGPDGPRWLVAYLRPSHDPLRALAKAVFDVFSGLDREPSLEEILSALRDDPCALRALAAEIPPGCVLLLVIDQMEELFTLGMNQGASFEALLSDALAAPESMLCLLTTLNSDFLHRFNQTPKLARQLDNAARYQLGPMDEDALKQVVQGMAQRTGLKLDDTLAGRMVRDAASADCRLPLLGHTLRALWSPWSEAPSTLEQRYEQIDGVGGALVLHAEALLAELGEEGNERAKWIILNLVQVGRGVPDTRRSRSRREVMTAAGGDRLAEEVVMLLSGARYEAPVGAADLQLLVMSGDPALDRSEQRVDLIHETLLRKVPAVVRWLHEERSRLEGYAALESAAHDWQASGCPAEGLPTGVLLERYRGPPEDERRHELRVRMTSERARRFLEAAERSERRARLRRQRVFAALFVAGIISLGSAVYAFRQKQRAESTLLNLSNATDHVVSDIDWELSRRPGTVDIRFGQLKSTEGTLMLLSTQDREKPEVSRIIIKTKHRLGDLALSDGSLESAAGFFVEARTELERNGDRASVKEPWRKLWALNDSKLGKVAQARDQPAEARRYFESALGMLARLPEDTAEDAEDFNRTLATSYSELAELELEQGALDRAARLQDEAIELLEPLQGDYNRSLLAEALCARSAVARQAGDLTLAADRLERARRIQEPLVQSSSANAHRRFILARIHIEIAALHAKQKQPEAAQQYQNAYALGQELLEGDPTRKSYALVLGESLRGIQARADIEGDHRRAEEASRERHALADHFVRRDGEDARFQRLAGP